MSCATPTGRALAYVYSRATKTDAMQAKVLTDDEARRVAVISATAPSIPPGQVALSQSCPRDTGAMRAIQSASGCPSLAAFGQRSD
jgi:hypothetical protein